MFRFALQKYIDFPENEENVLFYSDDYVILKDAYPKSFRHLLVMPRSELVTHTHPLVALRDREFVSTMQAAVKHARRLLVEDLIEIGFLDTKELDHFQKSFIKAGVHSVPSMSNLHIHVITQDFFLPLMKNKKHYNSFTTPFFVEFPEQEEEVQRGGEQLQSDSDSSLEYAPDMKHTTSGGKLLLRRRKSTTAKMLDVIRSSPLTCTYCHRLYGNRFSMLKAHLADEFAGNFGAHDPPERETAAAPRDKCAPPHNLP